MDLFGFKEKKTNFNVFKMETNDRKRTLQHKVAVSDTSKDSSEAHSGNSKKIGRVLLHIILTIKLKEHVPLKEQRPQTGTRRIRKHKQPYF